MAIKFGEGGKYDPIKYSSKDDLVVLIPQERNRMAWS